MDTKKRCPIFFRYSWPFIIHDHLFFQTHISRVPVYLYLEIFMYRYFTTTLIILLVKNITFFVSNRTPRTPKYLIFHNGYFGHFIVYQYWYSATLTYVEWKIKNLYNQRVLFHINTCSSHETPICGVLKFCIRI